MVLLYTRATPCPTCTEELIKTKRLLDQKYPQARIPITVAYTTDPQLPKSGMTSTTINSNNRKNLRDHGFTVVDMKGGGGIGGGGQLFRSTKPLLSSRFNMNTFRRPGQGRLGYTVPTIPNNRRVGTGGQHTNSSSGGGGGQFFRQNSPLLRPPFNTNSYLSGSSYWNFLRNQRRLGQGGLGYTQPSTTNSGRFGTGSQTRGWGVVRNRFTQRPPTNTGGRIANLFPAPRRFCPRWG